MTHFIDIPIRGMILSGIEGIWHRKETLRDDVLSKMIYELYGRHRLGGFDHYKIGDILPGV